MTFDECRHKLDLAVWRLGNSGKLSDADHHIYAALSAINSMIQDKDGLVSWDQWATMLSQVAEEVEQQEKKLSPCVVPIGKHPKDA